MTIARQIADMIDSGGDVDATYLDNVPASDWNTLLNVPAHANIDKRIGSNITSAIIPAARFGSGTTSSSTYLRGDGTWTTNCTNHGNCSNCSGTSTLTNCAGTLQTASGTAAATYGGTLAVSGTNVLLTPGVCACACACACNC
jgi:hypothetical protein